jgi:hypothetical protein
MKGRLHDTYSYIQSIQWLDSQDHTILAYLKGLDLQKKKKKKKKKIKFPLIMPMELYKVNNRLFLPVVNWNQKLIFF